MTDAGPSLAELINRQLGKPAHAPLAQGAMGLPKQEQPGGVEKPSRGDDASHGRCDRPTHRQAGLGTPSAGRSDGPGGPSEPLVGPKDRGRAAPGPA